MNNGQPAAFPSLTALRTAHNGLLQAHREQGESALFLDEIEQFLQQGRATGALLDVEQDRSTAQSLLDYWMATLLGAGRQPSDALLADFDPTLAPELPDALCPYVGLDAFREEKSTLFYGRQRLAQLLIDKLKESRLLAVVGPSGSGKSSLVLAGLIPALKAGAIAATENAPSSDQWRYAPRIVPGSDPLATLARLLQSAGVDAPAADVQGIVRSLTAQVAHLQQDGHSLTQLVNTTGNVPAVLVVDQFEELFTLCADEAARQAFANNLLTLTQAPGRRHTVILTLRTDFESFIMRLPGFQPFFEQALVRVTPLNAAELREAIEKPAEAVGLKFEAGIVDALLQDTLGEPAALPLLQFSLLKLWEARERNRITWEAYRRLGGGRLALARSADDLYESLIPEEQVTARRILLRLVRPGEGLETTSGRARRDTLYQTGEARDRIDRVLQKLIDARLLRVSEGDTSGDLQIEVTHEALVRNWPRLVAWLEEERERIRDRLSITAAAEQWEKVGRDPGALLRGALLEEALDYADLNQLELQYVRASQEALAAVEREKEAARQRELAQVRALAEEQRQRADSEQKWGEFQAQTATRLRQRAVILTVLAILALLLAATAGLFGFQWNQNAIIASSKATEASNERGIAEAASTQAAQQAVAAETARAAAVVQAETAQAARVAAQTSEAVARENEQQAQFALGAVQAVLQELQKTPTAPFLDEVTPTPLPQNLETVQAVAIDNGLPAVVLDTPTPANLATATDVAAIATAIAQTTGTYTPVPTGYVTPILIEPTPSPENALTAVGLATEAAVAALTATPTPFPFNGVVISAQLEETPTPTTEEVAAADATASPTANPLADATLTPESVVTPTQTITDSIAVIPTPTAASGELAVDLVAIIPDIEVSLFEQPDTNAAMLGTLRAPDRLPVLEATSEWVKVATPEGGEGWIRAWLVTYAGNPERLPLELRYLVVSNQEDVPFTYGQAISFGDAGGDYLLKDANNEQSGVVWVPVGTPLTLLFTAQGSPSYGSGLWYFVTLVDPGGENRIWLGYLPAEVIAPQ